MRNPQENSTCSTTRYSSEGPFAPCHCNNHRQQNGRRASRIPYQYDKLATIPYLNMKETKKNKAEDGDEDTPANHAKKNTDHTVFVRFVPPSSLLRRHHMEQYFSQIGPIKKASLIIPKASAAKEGETTSSSNHSKSSYGFIKYTCKADAVAAAKQLHKSNFQLPSDAAAESTYSSSTEPTSFQVMVELASNVTNQKQQQQQQSKGNDKDNDKDDTATTNDNKDASAAALLEAKKKQNRVMVKNLSFYAKESHVQAALEPFGKLVEVHIPKVQGKSRGFAFCTFDQKTQAQAAIDAVASGKGVLIKQRKVQVDWSMSKKLHQQQQEKAEKNQRKQDYQTKVKEELKREQGYQGGKQQGDDDASSSEGDDNDNDDDDDDESSSSEEVSDSEEENNKDDKKEEGDDDDEDEEEEDENLETDENHDDDKEKQTTREDKQKAIEEQRELFVRNLPFDATRHDVFETFRSFGTIQAIYIVVNPQTKLPRGTCFVTFATAAGAARAMKLGGANKYDKDNPMASLMSSSGILCKNRPLLVDYAVDKEVAMTLKKDPSSEEKSNPGRDKRNIYLKGVGRVDEEKEWDSLLESDRNKRERAWSDKITKLKSPLFFINPFRLSIRNISKIVDEGTLKKLLFDATQRGLERKLVKTEDLIAHWRASGEFTAREILEKTKEHKANKDNNVLSVNSLDEKNTKRTIPSVYLDRDFDASNAASTAASGNSGAKKTAAPSRGFAFAEFTHHVHAMACLRELNNNPIYSEEYSAGGKGAAAKANAAKKRRHIKKKKTTDGDGEEGGAVKIPRLIVEFTVENKAKARQQAEHRAQQQANRLKQKMETREKRELASSTAGSDGKKAEVAGGKTSNKRGRGAKQREKKRQRRLQGDDGDDDSDGGSPVDKAEAQKRKFRHPDGGDTAAAAKADAMPIAKAIKPPKKQKKREREELEVEEKFSKLVDKYKAAFAGAGVQDGNDAKATAATAKSKDLESGKRWFE